MKGGIEMDEDVNVTEVKLTERQEEYLLYLAARGERGSGITEVAQTFGVSKASASVACTAIERYGMIMKPEHTSITLTSKGRDYIAEKLALAREVATCLTEKLGIPPVEAESEARKIVVTLQRETVDLMINSWKYPETMFHSSPDAMGLFKRVYESHVSKEQLRDPFETLERGAYQVPFSVLKKGTRELSMGDRGFLKPAELVHEEQDKMFYFRASRFSYKPMHRKLLDGLLERLWYQIGEAWYESKETEEGFFKIPEEAVRFYQDINGVVGLIRIRARASVGLRKMPESEADLTFYLRDLRRKKGQIHNLPMGTYELPFEVRKAGKSELSMGDLGFHKPGELEVQDRGAVLFLKARHVIYKPDHKKAMEGALQRLWYQVDGNWYESNRMEGGRFEIPDSALYVKKDARQYVGTVRIKARATVGIRKMPESEADIVFDLNQLREKV